MSIIGEKYQSFLKAKFINSPLFCSDYEINQCKLATEADITMRKIAFLVFSVNPGRTEGELKKTVKNFKWGTSPLSSHALGSDYGAQNSANPRKLKLICLL